MAHVKTGNVEAEMVTAHSIEQRLLDLRARSYRDRGRDPAREFRLWERVRALAAEVAAAAEEEVLVATNAGTYGAAEACRRIGTGDPHFADRTVHERVGDGRRRPRGPAAEDAPGYPRTLNTAVLADRRRRLSALLARLDAAEAELLG